MVMTDESRIQSTILVRGFFVIYYLKQVIASMKIEEDAQQSTEEQSKMIYGISSDLIHCGLMHSGNIRQ